MSEYKTTPNVTRWLFETTGLELDNLDAEQRQRAVEQYAEAMGAPLETVSITLGERIFDELYNSSLSQAAEVHGYYEAGDTLHAKVVATGPGRRYSLTVDEAEVVATYADTALSGYLDEPGEYPAEVKSMRNVLARLEAEGVYPL